MSKNSYNSDDLLKIAKKYHHAGQFVEAERLYQRLINENPNDVEALHLLGVLAIQTGNHPQAIMLIAKAIALDPKNPSFYLHLGAALQGTGRLEEAIASYQQALGLNPDSFQIHNNLALCFSEAGNSELAIYHYQRAIISNPNEPDIYQNFAETLLQQHRVSEAVSCYQQVLRLNPNSVDVYLKLGQIASQQLQWDSAMYHYQRALLLKPDDFEIHLKLGNIYEELGYLIEASQNYKRALEINPHSSVIYNNLGIVTQQQGNLEQAIHYYHLALRLNPDYVEVWSNLANAFEEQGNLKLATQHYQQALSIQPDHQGIRFNLALLFLKSGNFTAGWELYDSRLLKNNWAYPHPKKPLWDGSPLAGRWLWVCWEQGFGDTIQFIRLLPLIQGGRIIFSCQMALYSLLKNCAGIDKLVVTEVGKEPEIEYDLWIPLLSLPRLLAIDFKTLPAKVPYIYPDADKVTHWQERLPSNGFNVGIVWAGNLSNKQGRRRPCALAHFQFLAQLPQVNVYSLQKGDSAKQAAPPSLNITSLSEELHDFSDTAAVISCLDLVITVDTAVAHLAGALGRPVWILLSASCDWRWWTARTDSPWYPTARLFRQVSMGEWNELFLQVAENFREKGIGKPVKV